MAWSKIQIRLFLGMIVAIGFFGLIASLVFIEIPESNRDIFKVLVGFVGGAFITMISFYFGSSEGQ